MRKVVALVVLLLAAACTSSPAPPTPAPPQGATAALPACPQPGPPTDSATALPDLSLPCLGGDGSAAVPLRRLTGTPMVINLWASWCAPCRAELPALSALSARAGPKLRVLGVASLDVPDNSVSYASDSRLPFPSLQDRDGDLLRGLRRHNVPATVLVKADGSVAEVYQGPPLTDSTLRELVKDKLGVDV